MLHLEQNYMNQYVALRKDKLDFGSYKNIIKLRCLEADHVSGRDPKKANDMLQQVHVFFKIILYAEESSLEFQVI